MNRKNASALSPNMSKYAHSLKWSLSSTQSEVTLVLCNCNRAGIGVVIMAPHFAPASSERLAVSWSVADRSQHCPPGQGTTVTVPTLSHTQWHNRVLFT